MYRRFALALILPAALAAQSKGQQKHKFEIDEIRATGCVRESARGHCLLLHTLDGQTTYTFLAAPKPDSGTVITILGKAHQGESACKEGIPVDIVDWQPTGERCEEPRK